MVIRPDGKISLCCNDALGQITLGDASKTKIIDIWFNEKFEEVRKHLAMREGRGAISVCRYCNHYDGRELWEAGVYDTGLDWSKRVFPTRSYLDKEAVIFGLNYIAFEFFEWLKQMQYKVVGFTSNGEMSISEKDGLIQGIKYIPLEDLIKIKDRVHVYITESEAYKEITQELLCMGFSDISYVI